MAKTGLWTKLHWNRYDGFLFLLQPPQFSAYPSLSTNVFECPFCKTFVFGGRFFQSTGHSLYVLLKEPATESNISQICDILMRNSQNVYIIDHTKRKWYKGLISLKISFRIQEMIRIKFVWGIKMCRILQYRTQQGTDSSPLEDYKRRGIIKLLGS